MRKKRKEKKRKETLRKERKEKPKGGGKAKDNGCCVSVCSINQDAYALSFWPVYCWMCLMPHRDPQNGREVVSKDMLNTCRQACRVLYGCPVAERGGDLSTATRILYSTAVLLPLFSLARQGAQSIARTGGRSVDASSALVAAGITLKAGPAVGAAAAAAAGGGGGS